MISDCRCSLSDLVEGKRRRPRMESQVEPQTILVVGYYGFGNVGDEAILTAMLHDFRSRLPGRRIVVTSQRPDDTAATYGIEAIDWRNLNGVSEAISQASLVVLGGGGLLNSYVDYSGDALLSQDHSLFSVFVFGVPLLAYLMRVPCLIYAAGASGITSSDAKIHVRTAIEVATRCSVRDEGSKRILQSLGCDVRRVVVTADPAFRLQNASASRADQICAQEGISASRGLIAVSVRNWPFMGEAATRERNIAEALVRVAQRQQADLLFIPFEANLSLGEVSDDRIAIQRVLTAIDKRVTAHVLRGTYLASEVSEVIRRCQLLVGMRLHSLILAIKNAVPFVGLVYDPKVFSVMSDANLTDSVIPADSTSDRIVDAAMHVADGGSDLRAQLTRVGAKLAKRADVNNELAVELMRRSHIHKARETSASVIEAVALRQTRRVLSLEAELQDWRLQREIFAELLRNEVAAGALQSAIPALQKLLSIEPNQPEWNYLLAFCLHQRKADLTLALSHYNVALRTGFDPFWVLYNRGSLHASLGNTEAARDDLTGAETIRPGHEGVRVVRASLDAARDARSVTVQKDASPSQDPKRG